MNYYFNRFLSLFKLDFKLEIKYGFYHATIFVTIIWLIVLSYMNANLLYNLFPFFVLSNMTITSFYFLSAMILFEKGERTIHRLSTTPIRFWEYMVSKLLTISVIAVLESLVLIAIIFRDFDISYGWLILGLFFLSVVNSYLGFISVSKYDNVNDFFFPSVLWLSLTSVPVAWFLGIGSSVSLLYFIIPTMGPFVLISTGFGVSSSLELILGFVFTIVSIPVLHHIAKNRNNRYIIRESI